MITPKKYMEVSLLGITSLPNYQTVDRIIGSFQRKPTAYHIPPSPKDASLPEHLQGFKDMAVFITSDSEEATPDIQELSEGRFIIDKPSGVVIIPPGGALLAAIEKRTNVDFAKLSLQELCETLPRFFLEVAGLADDIELAITDQSSVKLKLTNSIYKNLYVQENRPKSISLLGCPLVSAITCAIAKTTGKPTIIEEQKTSPQGLRLQVSIKTKQD